MRTGCSEPDLRQLLKFSQHLYAESLALKQLTDQAGLDRKAALLPLYNAGSENAQARFERLHTAADAEQFHEALQHFLGIKHG